MKSPKESVQNDAAEIHRSEIEALLRMLDLSEGTFSLSVAVCNAPALRDSLIAAVEKTRPGIEQLELPAGIVDVYGFVKEHAQPDRRDGLFLTGLEASVSSRRTDNLCLTSLNASRDLWEEWFHRPIVLWLPEYAVSELTEEARDLWRYLSHYFYFVQNEPDFFRLSHVVSNDRFNNALNLTADEKEARMNELRARLRAADRTSTAIIRHMTEWTCELSLLLKITGDLIHAEQVCRELLPVALEHQELPAAALLWKSIADVLESRGNLNEALRVRREEILPAFERLGDASAKATTMGQIADVLMEKGQLNEALRIRREEQLPVYEQLGDIREKAVTMAQIADMLRFDGKHDEALRLVRDEVLPVFERLNDALGIAITLGVQSDLLEAKGDLDEALRIKRDEVIPVFECLGAAFELLIGRTNLALLLLRRNASTDREEAVALLRQAHAAAVRMGIPEADQIRAIMDGEGF